MIYSGLDDVQLLQLLQKKNEGAFAEIYNRYWKLLYTTAYNTLQTEEIAKDAVQEVFISLWQRSAEAGIQQLRPYLQQAVRFQALKAIRAQKVDKKFYNRLSVVTADIIYENPLLLKEQEAFINNILGKLPDNYRQVFMMSREQKLTYKQIAAELHISEKTVEKRISACLKYIREILQKSKILLLAISAWLTCHF